MMLFAEVQANLAADGFLLRGAITEGQHYQDKEIVFGEALLEAVDLDKAGAPPRLVIGSSVEPLISQHLKWYYGPPAPHYYHLLEDLYDGRLFVNYLGVAFENFPDGPINYKLLKEHRQVVIRGLQEYESVPNVHEKYKWTAIYHNYVCRTFADQFPVVGSCEADLEEMAYRDEAQHSLDYLVPFEAQTTDVSPRPLDALRLQQRIDTNWTPP